MIHYNLIIYLEIWSLHQAHQGGTAIQFSNVNRTPCTYKGRVVGCIVIEGASSQPSSATDLVKLFNSLCLSFPCYKIEIRIAHT